jgi:hypothetical protein
MALAKNIYLPFQLTGLSGIYMRIRQASTGYYLDHADGAFRAVPATPNIPLVEVVSLPSVYYRSEDRTAWTTGEYNIVGYDATNALICGATMFILNDTEVSQATLMEYMEFIDKMESGNWELVGNKWIYYDTNGTTILRQFNVKDSAGNPSMTSIYKREVIP